MFFVLPFKVDRALKRLPLVTIILISVNVIVCLATFLDIHSIAKVAGFRMDVNGTWTWFTSMFLHVDPVFHLGGNMYFLWLFGSVVEDAIGRVRYILLYLAGGLAASLAHGLMVLAFMPQLRNVPAIGASGALAAVVGVFAVRFYKTNMRLAYFVWILVFIRYGVWRITSVAGVALWAARELLSGLIAVSGAPSGVANWAHLGGLAFGIVASMTFGFVREADHEYLGDEAAEYAAAGTHSIAAQKYRRLAETAPEDPEVLVASACESAAAGQETPASRDFGKAVGLLSRSGRTGEIVEAYERFRISGAPVKLDARTLQTVGSAADAARRYDLAVPLYRELVERYPASREAERAVFRIAHVYLASGMEAEALQTWAWFTRTYPNSEWNAYADVRFSASA
ncbi:MAG TPA: rhomboid family intramembrane serine protease [Coriobacteriia bacterium]|jgi:membrane associated rhomboid family serine protease